MSTKTLEVNVALRGTDRGRTAKVRRLARQYGARSTGSGACIDGSWDLYFRVPRGNRHQLFTLRLIDEVKGVKVTTFYP